MLPAKSDTPIEIIITDEVILSNDPRRSSACSLSISTADVDELNSSIPQFIEMTPGNYYEILESRWESEYGLNVGSDKSPNCVSAPPWPMEPCTTHELGYASLETNNNNANGMGRPSRRTSRGSLVMTLKKTTMHQEDTSRRESVVSPAKPTMPHRRGSLMMSFENTTEPTSCLVGVPAMDNSRRSSASAPVRPFRRASIVMNMAQSPEETNKPKRPFRRGSLILSFADMEYESAEPTAAQSSVPPKCPSRKASIDLCGTDFEGASNTSQRQRQGSLVWTVTSSSPGGEDDLEQIYLKLTGSFSIDEEQDTLRNDNPKCPHMHFSIDTKGSSCA